MLAIRQSRVVRRVRGVGLCVALALAAPPAWARKPVNTPKGCPEDPAALSAAARQALPEIRRLFETGKQYESPQREAMLQVLLQWYTASVFPRMKKAAKDDSDLTCAICEWVAWWRKAELHAITSDGPAADATSRTLTEKVETIREMLAPALGNAVKKAYERCVSEKDPYQAPRILGLYKFAEIVGVGSQIAPGGFESALGWYDDCARWTVDFDSTITYANPTPLVERTSLFVSKDNLLEPNPDAPGHYRSKKPQRFQHEEKWWDPSKTPPRYTDWIGASFEALDVRIPLPQREESCPPPNSDHDEFPEIFFGYTPEAKMGFWQADYGLFFHRSEMVKDPAAWPLVGQYVSRNFDKGSGDVFARKQYSSTDRKGNVIQQEETEIRIRHTPKERKLTLPYEKH